MSKYNQDSSRKLVFLADKVIVLVVGQVEDDASIIYRANGATNLELLKEVNKKHSDKYIVYKPHPDVLSGNREGSISKDDALQYCDEIIKDISMADTLNAVDEVHTLTSLTGFEGLFYRKKLTHMECHFMQDGV